MMNWVSSEGSRWGVDVSEWSHAQNKQFEDALAVYDRDTPDRWQKVAAMIPGKSVADVTRHYQELEDDVSMIEAGLLPVCEYEDDDGKRPAGARRSEQERKKGVPWTEEEHKLFLMGLKKHGKGDWRNISRNFVVTRTPTQVASHAQKYFLRQVSGAKDKRRASIHDITTSTLDSHPLAYGASYHGRIGRLPSQSHHGVLNAMYLCPPGSSSSSLYHSIMWR